jgi:hypothetical protein
MTRLVTLQFSSLTSLKALQMKINLMFFEVSAQGKLLHCAYTDEQIALAKAKFNAVIVDKNGVRQPSIGS